MRYRCFLRCFTASEDIYLAEKPEATCLHRSLFIGRGQDQVFARLTPRIDSQHPIYKVAGIDIRFRWVSVKGFQIRDLRNWPVFAGFVQVGKIATC